MPMHDDWRHRAACRDEDPELFFPVSEAGPGARQTEQAKAVCAGCPVRARCLEYALDNGLDYGIFGGTTETERRMLRRRARYGRPAA
jgi:WhiB family transcriptional regulator, redox-sensing transcriptional regulator